MALNYDERKRIGAIVFDLLEPSNRYSERTSYGLKHIFERLTGLYVTNDEMKSILLEIGYKPDNKAAVNQRFKIRFKRL